MLEYAALVVSPRALPDSLILVFQHLLKSESFFTTKDTKGTKV